jgi:hypothetical protein
MQRQDEKVRTKHHTANGAAMIVGERNTQNRRGIRNRAW